MEPIAVNFSMIRAFLSLFKRTNPAFNTLVVGKKSNENNIFAIALTEKPSIAGFVVYPATKFTFWRRFTMRKECIYVMKVEHDICVDPNQFFNDAYPLTKKEAAIFKKYGYKVIVKAQMRNYSIKEPFELAQ